MEKSVNYWLLFGYLLWYPTCCIRQFIKKTGVGRRSINGFVPCDEHTKLSDEELTVLLGRNPETEPEAFQAFLETDLSFEEGLRVYVGHEKFFTSCWENAKDGC